jgi:hypothetical protein
VLAGLMIPLANVMFPKAVIIGLSGGLSIFGTAPAREVQILAVLTFFFRDDHLGADRQSLYRQENQLVRPLLTV